MEILKDLRKIRALVLDMDGTTLDPDSLLRERTIRAIKACMNRGIRIIISTGRAIESAELFRVALGAEGPMSYYNGAVIAEMPGTKILSATLLDPESAGFCVDLSRETGVYCQVFFPGTEDDPRIKLMAERDDPHRKMYHEHTGILAELVDLKETLRRPGVQGCVKFMFLAEPEVQAMLRPRLDEHFGKSIYVTQALRTFLEVMNSKVSKGQGLKFIMERLSLKSEEVIAIGDDENDIPMLKAAGFSAAPSNAKDSVKAVADIVIGSNAEDGVAAFLESVNKSYWADR